MTQQFFNGREILKSFFKVLLKTIILIHMIDQGRNNLSAGLTTAYTLKSHFRVETC